MGNQNSTPIQNCGIYVQGNLTASNLSSFVGNSSSSPSSQDANNQPFRFNIPTPTPHFKGRIKTMKDVRKYFTKLPHQAANCWEKIVAIVGFGGMGKTETTYKFAYDNKELFPNVAWINAETEQSILTSFLELAKHLGIVPQSTERADVNLVKQVYREIDRRDRGRVLFIFDNALQLNSNGTEFGILNYLPTEDLPNGRFPYIIITTQTDYWERGITKFQVDALTEKESLEFFRSNFEVKASECTEDFKKLHEILEGYPLVMNLAAAQIDYDPKKYSVHHLKRQISNYIDKLGKEQNKILSEKVSRACSNNYNKTISNVWQLTFERIQQEENGQDALELLQLMSFLHVPIKSYDVVDMLADISGCPHPSKEELEIRMKNLVRVLERFYTVRMMKVQYDSEYGFSCTLGIHRLLQVVVRQRMDSSIVFERVLFLFILAKDYKYRRCFNKSALEEALHRIPLSQQALPYVGVLACQGFPACKFVERRPPETKAASTIWRLYSLERGMKYFDENATQVLRELIELTKSEERLADRFFFVDIAMSLLIERNYWYHTRDDGTEVPGYFDLNTLDGIEELAVQLILNAYSLQDLSCNSYYCKGNWDNDDYKLARLTAKLSKTFIQVNAPYSVLTVDVISDTWLALFARLKYYVTHENDFPNSFEDFWRKIYDAFHSPDASQSTIGALKTCLWNRGLAKELIQVFEFIRDYPYDFCILDTPWLLRMMDVCTYRMDMTDQRVQEVISSFFQMAASVEKKFISKDHSHVHIDLIDFAVSLCSLWVKLFSMIEHPPPHKFLDSLSQLEFLVWMERSPKLNNKKKPFFGDSMFDVPDEYRSNHFPQVIQRFSSFDIEPIKTLVNVSRRLMEDCEGWRRSEKTFYIQTNSARLIKF